MNDDKIYCSDSNSYHMLQKNKKGVSQWRLRGSGRKSRLGHKGQAGLIDNGLMTGRMSIDELRLLSGAGRGKPKEVGNKRVRQHFKALSNKGLNVVIGRNGRCYIENDSVSYAAYAAYCDREDALAAAQAAAKAKHVRRMAAYAGMQKKKA